MTSRMSRLLIRIFGFGVACVALSMISAWLLLLRPVDLSRNHSAKINSGSSVVAAVATIDAQCPLPNPSLVSLAARVTARLTGRGVQRGWYRFNDGDTQLDVLKALFGSHRRPSIRVTLPEGLTYREIAAILSRSIEADSAAFVAWCESDTVLRTYGAAGRSMEGYLMPDTYTFYWRDDVHVIGDRLATEFQERWAQHCEGILAESGRTKHDVITLASIVQAEAAQTEEMPRIAGVYANRLARNMRLEADPTVQYGRGERSRVLYKHLEHQSLYNTYQVFGLPPGPICNAGLDALRAALQPEEHSYLFFVARGDGTGGHYFAETGAEHVTNVRRYRARRN